MLPRPDLYLDCTWLNKYIQSTSIQVFSLTNCTMTKFQLVIQYSSNKKRISLESKEDLMLILQNSLTSGIIASGFSIWHQAQTDLEHYFLIGTSGGESNSLWTHSAWDNLMSTISGDSKVRVSSILTVEGFILNYLGFHHPRACHALDRHGCEIKNQLATPSFLPTLSQSTIFAIWKKLDISVHRSRASTLSSLSWSVMVPAVSGRHHLLPELWTSQEPLFEPGPTGFEGPHYMKAITCLSPARPSKCSIITVVYLAQLM